MKRKFSPLIQFSSSFAFISILSFPLISGASEQIKKVNNIKRANESSPINLYVYNSEDYIAEDEKDDSNNIISEGVITKFEKFEKEQGKNVKVIYSCFDTNESMLNQLRMGNENYDLICTSDYVVQKMIQEKMIIPFENDDEEVFSSTPNYDDYGSNYIKDKLGSVEVKIDSDDKYVMNKYCRGYMWGTLGLLYNTTFSKLEKRNIDPDDLDKDMESYSNLWDTKYKKLLSIKDSMRDTYAIGLLETYKDDFTLNNVSYDGFSTLYKKYLNGDITLEEYEEKGNDLFNFCDSTTISRVKENLINLRDNAYGFEVDSGKSDMARGNYFAINLAWSGDACWAMEMADEFNEEHEKNYPDDESFSPTILKYSIPEGGSNMWCDAWVMTNAVEKHNSKEIAQDFVNFLSDPEIACQNMDYIGYTSCIAGDAVLDYLYESNDIRYDEEKEEIDDEILDEYNILTKDEIKKLESDKDIEEAVFEKNISYFFDGTLEEYTNDDACLYIEASEISRSFDASYPDEVQLPSLFVMRDYGSQSQEISKMWQQIKNKILPLWVYILVIAIVSGLITLVVYNKVKKTKELKRRKASRASKSLAN